MNIPTEKELIPIVEKLQKILRIQDWDIEVKILADEEFIKLYGQSEQGYNQTTRLLNSSYITINKDVSDDWYRTLIHELLHLNFDHLETCENLVYNLNSKQNQEAVDDVFKIALERTVERIAEVITQLYPVTNFIEG